MISPGMDGLSQGIWVSSFHPEIDQQEVVSSIFAPFLASALALDCIIHDLGFSKHPYQLRDLSSLWDLSGYLYQFSLWCPQWTMLSNVSLGFLRSGWRAHVMLWSCLLCLRCFRGVGSTCFHICWKFAHTIPPTYHFLLPTHPYSICCSFFGRSPVFSLF